MDNDVLLQVEDVWVERPGAEVLRGVNLTVRRGEVHALLGLNGSGKTSLALTLMGAGGYHPDRGRILFHGRDITAFGVTDGGRVSIASRRGQIEARVKISPKAVTGTVFIPFHYAQGAANKLTNAALDPISGIPEYKVCAVKLQPVS